MNKYISKFYLLCMVLGFTVFLIGLTYQNNSYVGKVWDGNKEIVNPVEVIQQTNQIREYHFCVSDMKKGKNCILFYTAHTNVKAYIDTVTEENLIYQFASNETIFGKTDGAAFHFVEVPPSAENIVITIDSVYDVFNKEVITYYQCDGIAAFRELMKESLIESLISCFLILLGSILIVYWLITCRRVKLENSVIYFGIFATLLGAWTFNETNMATLMFSNRTMASLMGFMLLFMMMQPMILFTHSFLKVKNSIFCYLYCTLVTITMFICVFLHLSGIKEIREIALVVHIIFCIGILYMCFCMVYHIVIYGLDRRVVVNLIGEGILLTSGFIDLAAYYADNRINDVIGRCGMLLYIIIVATEVMNEFTQQLKESRKIAYYKDLATIDILTGVQNRNAFANWENINEKCEQITLATFDLNNLKQCNDSKGHLTGDQYIIDAAKIIQSVFGKYGTCYRIGGDEFLVVMQNSNKIDMDKLITLLRKQEVEYNKHEQDVTMEIACGYATKQGPNESIEMLRQRADDLMYENKVKLKQRGL